MSENEKIAKIADALDTEATLVPETVLNTLDEWDSMGKVSIIALLNIRDIDEVKRLETIRDILDKMP